ncbi:hypothetical protein [Xylella fastidiosa]|uniref:hypothetical protein n=1 Tax=Xylella fastidiosa TaxID=2371 RepID=UPI0039853C24
MNRIGRGLQQLITDKDSAKGRALQQRIDTDAQIRKGLTVSVALQAMCCHTSDSRHGWPRGCSTGSAWQAAGKAAQLPAKAGVAAAEGRTMGAWEKPARVKTGRAHAGYGALGRGLQRVGALGAARGVTSGLHVVAIRSCKRILPSPPA